MTRSWNKPNYLYRPEPIGTQIKRLLGEFLRANNNDRQGLAKSLESSDETISRWLAGKATKGLFTKVFTQFVETTGIDLDRLMVIEAKLRILEKLGQVDELRTKDPSYAFLLDLDPDLSKKVSFDRLITRREIVDAVKAVADEIGGPLTSLQFFADERYVPSWWSDKNGAPAGEILERTIIRLTVGFVRDDPTLRARDDTRFRVMAHLLLGPQAQEHLGATTLQDALRSLFGGKEKWQSSALSNETGIPVHALYGLREWAPKNSTGKLGPVTIVAIMKALLKKRGYEERLGDLDNAFTAFALPSSRGWSGKPVFWRQNENARVENVSAQPTREAPTLPASPTEPPIREHRRAEPTPSPATTQTTLLARIEFARAVATLQVLLKEHPELRGQLPQEIVGTTQAKAPVDGFIALSRGTGVLSVEELAQMVVLLRGLPRIIQRLLESPDAVRDQALKQIDQPLLTIQQLLDAAASTEPRLYLEQVVRPQSSARGIAHTTD